MLAWRGLCGVADCCAKTGLVGVALPSLLGPTLEGWPDPARGQFTKIMETCAVELLLKLVLLSEDNGYSCLGPTVWRGEEATKWSTEGQESPGMTG